MTALTSESLAPCPHCGASPQGFVRTDTEPGDWSVAVLCGKCGAKGGDGDTEAQAVAAWNKRDPAPIALATELLAAREALEWYGDQAKAAAKYMAVKDRPGPLEAILVALALDRGSRAALSPKEPRHE